MRQGVGAYVTVASLVALAGLGAAWLLAPAGLRQGWRWLLLGWAIMATLHVAGGAWMTLCHGRPGPGFLVALLGGMLSRLAGAAVGGAGALLAGERAALAYVSGLGAGFLPLQALDTIWFLRLARGARAGAE